MAREILTFQLGNYSNYIGTHWWNIQVSIASNIERKSTTLGVIHHFTPTLTGIIVQI